MITLIFTVIGRKVKITEVLKVTLVSLYLKSPLSQNGQSSRNVTTPCVDDSMVLRSLGQKSSSQWPLRSDHFSLNTSTMYLKNHWPTVFKAYRMTGLHEWVIGLHEWVTPFLWGQSDIFICEIGSAQFQDPLIQSLQTSQDDWTRF